MTNEQIIIDGVDVSECGFLTKTGHCKAHMSIMGTDINKCKCFSECDYKQLVRKEQECEELTKNYLTVIRQRNVAEHQLDRLKQTLTEIKEIAEHELKNLTDSAVHGGRYLEILDIISEVEL